MPPKKAPKRRQPDKKSSAKSTPARQPERPQTAPSWHGTRRQHGPANLFDAFLYADNVGEQAWRYRQAPACTIRIPRRLLNLSQQDECRNIARQNDAFIAPVDDCEFGIWARTTEDAQRAKGALEAWTQLSDAARQDQGGNPVKLRSFTPEMQEKMYKKWQDAVQTHLYRQCPPPGSCFGAIATFYWPADELNPREVLGNNLEALDPIRMKNSCYIIEDDDNSQIKILGPLKKVQTALLEIRQAFFQLIARQQTTRTAYLPHWTSDEAPEQIAVQIVQDSVLSQASAAIFRVEDWCNTLSNTPATSITRLTAYLHDTMKDLVHFSGKINFRIRLGTFLATSYLRPDSGQYSLTDFESMISQSQFSGKAVPELMRRSWQDNMHQRIRGTARIIPRDSTIEHCQDVHPVHTATFVFMNGKEGSHELIITWHTDGDGKIMPPLAGDWSRLDSHTQARTSLLDVHLLRLDTELSWYFDIDAANAVPSDRLPPKLRHFANRVKYRPRAERTQAQPCASFTLVSGCGLRSVTTATTYQYLVEDSGYHVDYTESQTFHYSVVKPALQPTSIGALIRSVEISHPQWETDFSANSKLRIGKSVDWQPDLERWLPAGEAQSGTDVLLDTLMYVENVLTREVEESTGMSIG